jgi:hypothetical protein
MAHRVSSLRRTNLVAIGGIADMCERIGSAQFARAIPRLRSITCHSANRGIARTSTSTARASIHQYRIFSVPRHAAAGCLLQPLSKPAASLCLQATRRGASSPHLASCCINKPAVRINRQRHIRLLVRAHESINHRSCPGRREHPNEFDGVPSEIQMSMYPYVADVRGK